jgi:Tol biopolymer transport system component
MVVALVHHLQRLTDGSAADQSPARSPGGAEIASVSDRDGNREIYVMNANGMSRLSGNCAPFGHTDLARSVAFSPDGSLLASGSFDHTVVLWGIPR